MMNEALKGKPNAGHPHVAPTLYKLVRPCALTIGCTVMLPIALLADDIAWVFSGDTNRMAVATAASANSATLKTQLSTEAVASPAVQVTTKPSGICIIFR